MQKKNEERKPLTIHEKWEKDSKQPYGGIGFDDSEWDGTYIEIEDKTKEKEK